MDTMTSHLSWSRTSTFDGQLCVDTELELFAEQQLDIPDRASLAFALADHIDGVEDAADLVEECTVTVSDDDWATWCELSGRPSGLPIPGQTDIFGGEA